MTDSHDKLKAERTRARYGIERAVMLHAMGKAHPDCGDPVNPGMSNHAADLCPLLSDAEDEAFTALIEKARLIGAASVPCYGVAGCECIPCSARAALAATGKEVTGE